MRVVCFVYRCGGVGGGVYTDGARREEVERWGAGFNSGVVVMGKNHLEGMWKHKGKFVDSYAVKRDQGYVNAVAYMESWDVADLGFSWNYLGSFMEKEGDEGVKGPVGRAKGVVNYGPVEANFVHVTTGIYANFEVEEKGSYVAREDVFRRLERIMP